MISKSASPDYLGHRQRLRERFLLGGGKDMADYELLELVLTLALPRRDVKPLAKQLIARFENFAGVINASITDLMQVSGVKENTAVALKIIQAAAVRTSWQALSHSDEPVINNFDAMLDYCRSVMCHQDIEELRLFYLDSKLKMMGNEVIQRGTINCVAIHPREVIKATLANKAASLIMCHNHPSGNVTPSAQDIEVTKQIKEACQAMNIKLHDHLVISKTSYYSFREHGFIA